MSNPLILYDNRLDDGTPVATATESGYSVIYLRDWKTYTFWKGDTTDPSYVTVDCGEGTIAVTGDNLCTNGADFTGGPPPTGWTAADCTLAAAAGGEAGNCLEITRTGGVSQSANTALTLTKGKSYRLSLYVKSGTSGDEAYLVEAFDVDSALACGQLSGTSTAAWVQATFDFVAKSANIKIYLHKYTATAGTMLFDTVTLYELTNVPMANTLGVHTHNLYTVGATITPQCSGDSITYIDTLTGFAPSDNLNIVKSFGVDYYARYWRLKIASHTAAPQMGILTIGEALDFPSPPKTQVDIYEVSVSGEGSLSKTGQLLGAVVRNKPVEINYTFAGNDYTYTWVSGDYRDFWEAHASEMKPFFFALDLTNFTDLHWLCRIQPDSSWKVPMMFKTRVEEVEINFEALWGV